MIKQGKILLPTSAFWFLHLLPLVDSHDYHPSSFGTLNQIS